MKFKKKMEARMLWNDIHLLKFIFLKIKNADFESRYMRTLTKETPSTISNITFATLLFFFFNKMNPD